VPAAPPVCAGPLQSRRCPGAREAWRRWLVVVCCSVARACPVHGRHPGPAATATPAHSAQRTQAHHEQHIYLLQLLHGHLISAVQRVKRRRVKARVLGLAAGRTAGGQLARQRVAARLQLRQQRGRDRDLVAPGSTAQHRVQQRRCASLRARAHAAACGVAAPRAPPASRHTGVPCAQPQLSTRSTGHAQLSTRALTRPAL
jgi:hypothetical protein